MDAIPLPTEVQNILDAIRKNGLPKHKGGFFKFSTGEGGTFPENIVAACAIGQAAINLDMGGNTVLLRLKANRYRLYPPEHLKAREPKRLFMGLGDFIVVSNDETDMTFAEIADAAESSYRSYHNI